MFSCIQKNKVGDGGKKERIRGKDLSVVPVYEMRGIQDKNLT
jgi:hypothetical protein